VLLLATWLLAQNVLPAHFPKWQIGTVWLTSAAIVLAGEAALLLHEVGHALVAVWGGQRVTRIVFHGFLAQTVMDENPPVSAHACLIAIAGPTVNAALAGLSELARLTLGTQGPIDALLLMLVIGNLAAAAMSLVPIGRSDGARALRALRRPLEAEVAGQRQDQNDQDQQT
jgi:Zn-dependent protease